MKPTPRRLLALWKRVGTSFWFVRSLTAAVTVALTLVMVQIDRPATDDPPGAAGEVLMGVAR